MNGLVLVVGFLAQTLFFARFLVQWILSEKAKRVLSPVIFWQLSIVASFLLFIYGWLRDDFAILLGQIIAYYIYIWNLKVQNNWQKFNPTLQFIFLITPAVAIGWLLTDWQNTVSRLFFNEGIPLPLLLWGTAGQIVFTFRFVYQWLYSRKRNESLLPGGFWLISISGATIILSYAIFRLDPVLILGQGTGIFVYSRNLYLSRRAEQKA
ncbi:MAG: lipid-A-disaccharide synthase N-terminal domain-containing protein [Bacteroidales bacterium]